MEPITLATLSTLFAVKVLEKTSEKLSEVLVEKTAKAIETIRHYDPKLAISIEVGDKQVLKLGKARLEKIPAKRIFQEFEEAVNEETNVALRAHLQLPVKKETQKGVSVGNLKGNLKANRMTLETSAPDDVSVEQMGIEAKDVTGDICVDDMSMRRIASPPRH